MAKGKKTTQTQVMPPKNMPMAMMAAVTKNKPAAKSKGGKKK